MSLNILFKEIIMTHNNLNEQILRKYCEDIKKRKPQQLTNLT